MTDREPTERKDGPARGPGAALPLHGAFEALERAYRALDPGPDRPFYVRWPAALGRWGLLLVQMEFLALAVPLLLLTGGLTALHLVGVWKVLKGRVIAYISVVAIASAVVIAFVPNPVMEGFLSHIKDKVRGASADLLVETSRDVDPELLLAVATGRARANNGRPRQAPAVIDRNVEAAAPRIEGFVVFSTGDVVDALDFASVVGVDPAAEYEVSRLREYIVAGGSDPDEPFKLGDGGLTRILRERRALAALGREAFDRLSEEARWAKLAHLASDMAEPNCVPEGDAERMVDELYEQLKGMGTTREQARSMVMTEVEPARRRVTAALLQELGRTARRALEADAFQARLEAVTLPPDALQSDEARALRAAYDRRPGVLVGAALLREKPDLSVGSEIEFITGAIQDPLKETRTRRKGGKNLIAYIAGAYDSGFFDHDVRTVYMDLEEALSFFRDTGAVRCAGLKLKDPAGAERLKPLFQEAIDPGSVDGYVVFTWKDKKQVILKAVSLQRRVLLVILFFAVFVAGFGILLSLRILVTEKVMDIGILMGIGASPVEMVIFYVLAGVGLGLAGSLLGVCLGGVIVHFSNEIVTFFSQVLGVSEFEMYVKDVQHLDAIPVEFNPSTLLIIVLFTLLASYQFALYPALVASKHTPLDAVRQK